LVLDASRGQLRGSIDGRAVVIATTEGLRGTRTGAEIAIAADLRLARPAARLLNAGLRPARLLLARARLA
jgi:hypothetical protein